MMIEPTSPVIKLYRDKKQVVPVFVKRKAVGEKLSPTQNKVDILV